MILTKIKESIGELVKDAYLSRSVRSGYNLINHESPRLRQQMSVPKLKRDKVRNPFRSATHSAMVKSCNSQRSKSRSNNKYASIPSTKKRDKSMDSQEFNLDEYNQYYADITRRKKLRYSEQAVKRKGEELKKDSSFNSSFKALRDKRQEERSSQETGKISVVKKIRKTMLKRKKKNDILEVAEDLTRNQRYAIMYKLAKDEHFRTIEDLRLRAMAYMDERDTLSLSKYLLVLLSSLFLCLY